MSAGPKPAGLACRVAVASTVTVLPAASTVSWRIARQAALPGVAVAQTWSLRCARPCWDGAALALAAIATVDRKRAAAAESAARAGRRMGGSVARRNGSGQYRRGHGTNEAQERFPDTGDLAFLSTAKCWQEQQVGV